MALYTGRLLIRGGNEADFNPDKMMPREWAVSTDKKIVRICIAPGICIRMATYEAFEEDMERVEEILRNCQDIQEAIERINTEVSQKANAVAEYTEEAKQYRDEAENFRNEAENFKNQAGEIVGIDIATTEKAGIVKPDGTTIRVDADGTIRADSGTVDYAELENKPSINGTELDGDKTLEELGIASAEKLDKTTQKVDTIIEKADLGIKETAIGENIHLTDSADSKVVEFTLYGKATQDGEPTPENPVDIVVSGESYNLLKNTATSQIINGVSFAVNEDKSITVNGTASSDTYLNISSQDFGKVFLNVGDNTKEYTLTSGLAKTDNWNLSYNANNKKTSLYVKASATMNNITIYPMIRKASVKNDRYMPYGVGSVEVKSVGKNLLKNTATTRTVNGVIITVNEDGTVDISGTPTEFVAMTVNSSFKLPKKRLKFSGLESTKNITWDKLYCYGKKNETITAIDLTGNINKNFEIDLSGSEYEEVTHFELSIKRVSNGNECSGTFYPMIRLATDTDSTYEPYKETLSTIPTDRLAGIPVSSGGNYTDQSGQQWICDEIVKYADGSGEWIENIKHYSLPISSMNNSNDEYPGWKNLPEISDLSEVVKVNANSVLGTFTKYICNITKIININTIGQNVLFFTQSVVPLTQTQWKEKYPDLVLELYVVRKTPIRTPLTAEQIAEIEKLSTFYPVTNISNDFDCGMRVKYLADSKLYIDNRLAQIEAALIANI